MSIVLISACVCLLNGQPPQQDEKPAAPASTLEPSPEWKSLGRSLWFDPRAKRLILRARVVLREGQLEHLLCLKGTKEHEAILATDAAARQIHAGLLLTGAEPGHPARFLPKFEPPTGTTIRIELNWKVGEKAKHALAQEWVVDDKTRKALARDWVFAGSELYNDPITNKTVYAADEGDLFTVANFGSSILDLPIASSASDAERSFSANTQTIPPLGTEVLMILEVKKPARPARP